MTPRPPAARCCICWLPASQPVACDVISSLYALQFLIYNTLLFVVNSTLPFFLFYTCAESCINVVLMFCWAFCYSRITKIRPAIFYNFNVQKVRNVANRSGGFRSSGQRPATMTMCIIDTVVIGLLLPVISFSFALN